MCVCVCVCGPHVLSFHCGSVKNHHQEACLSEVWGQLASDDCLSKRCYSIIVATRMVRQAHQLFALFELKKELLVAVISLQL